MKAKLLPLVMASLASGYAAAEVDVYGKVNVSFNKLDTETAAGAEDDTYSELNSNTSRIGFKGGYDINDSLKAVFKLEYEIDVDGDGSDVFKSRNLYGGFAGNWGTLVAGHHDTPLKMAQGKVDRFNDLTLGDLKNLIVGENRVPNIILYNAPAMGDFSATAAFISGESEKSDDGISVAIQYQANKLRVALAQDLGIKHTDTTRLVAEYEGDGFKLGALYQTAEEEDTGAEISSLKGPASEYGGVSYEEQDALLFSGEYTVASNIVLKGQIGIVQSDDAVTGDSVDTTQYAFGVDYKLNKESKLFAYYAVIDGEADDSIQTEDQTDATIGVGYEIKF